VPKSRPTPFGGQESRALEALFSPRPAWSGRWRWTHSRVASCERVRRTPLCDSSPTEHAAEAPESSRWDVAGVLELPVAELEDPGAPFEPRRSMVEFDPVLPGDLAKHVTHHLSVSHDHHA